MPLPLPPALCGVQRNFESHMKFRWWWLECWKVKTTYPAIISIEKSFFNWFAVLVPFSNEKLFKKKVWIRFWQNPSHLITAYIHKISLKQSSFPQLQTTQTDNATWHDQIALSDMHLKRTSPREDAPKPFLCSAEQTEWIICEHSFVFNATIASAEDGYACSGTSSLLKLV